MPEIPPLPEGYGWCSSCPDPVPREIIYLDTCTPCLARRGWTETRIAEAMEAQRISDELYWASVGKP